MRWGYVKTGNMLKDLLYNILGHPHPIGRLRAKNVLKFLEDKKTLDIGCGEGVFYIELSRKGLDVTGIDILKSSIKYTHNNCKSLIIDSNLVVGDVEYLPFEDNLFDQAICLDVLEHVKDPKSVLKEIFRVLTGGGTLILTVPNRLYLKDSLIPYDFSEHLKKIGHLRYGWNHKELKKMLESSGFETRNYGYYYKFFSRLIVEMFYCLIGSDNIENSRKSMYKHSLIAFFAFFVIYSFMKLDSLFGGSGGFTIFKAIKPLR